MLEGQGAVRRASCPLVRKARFWWAAASAGTLLRSSVICALTILGLSNCAWKIVPPARVADPVPVFVSEYGRHTRLALPDRTVALFDYGFGEWNFYGLEKEGGLSALRAISGLGAGALSRRELPFTLSEFEFASVAGSTRSARLLVERSLSEDLRRELESRWRSNAAVTVVRGLDGVPVSRDRAAYHLFDNSNHAVARWLKRLGCGIRGYPVTSNFEVINELGAAAHRSPRPRGGATPL
jgi:hypothetical protein